MNPNTNKLNENSLEKFVQGIESINKKYDEQNRQILESMQRELFPEKSDEAIKTLNRVLQEWNTGKQIIQWRVMTPNSKKGQYLYPLLIPALFAVIAFSIWVDNHANILSLLFIFITTIILYIIFYKNQKYSITKIKIYRNKHKGIFISEENRSKRIKYKQDFTLKAFRLPESNTAYYKDIRIQLQKAITAETGWNFDNHWEYMIDKEKREYIKSIGAWKGEYDHIENFLKSSHRSQNRYDDIS